jgi:hypothetical protein
VIDVKLSTCAPNWPWLRQFPGESGEWGPFRFHIDTEIQKCDAWVVFESLEAPDRTICPPERTIFITGEPDGIGNYSPAFLKQFHWIVTSRTDIKHPRVLRLQQGHPWFVEKSFDELIEMPPITKTKDVSVISSNKAFTLGHRQRLEFVDALKAQLGNKIDVFGRGIRDFNSKWEVLADYRYAIVLENLAADDWLTEKLPDAWLAYCYPIYFGCTNLQCYSDNNSSINIDINNPDLVVEKIRCLIDDPNHYESQLGNIVSVRRKYLMELQFFANLAKILELTKVNPIRARNIFIEPDMRIRRAGYLLDKLIGKFGFTIRR